MKREIDYEKVLEKCGLSMKRSRKNAGYDRAEIDRQNKEFDELEKKEKQRKKKTKINKIEEKEISEIESEYN